MSYQKLSAFIREKGLHNLAWITDLDGTMFDIHPDPEQVSAPAQLVQGFQKLHKETGGHFYIVSGRNLEFMDRVLYPFKAKISAEHHCQIRYDGGEPKDLVDRPDWELSSLKEKFAEVAQMADGVWVETIKIFSKTIHYRGVDEGKKTEIGEKLLEAAQNLANYYNEKVGKPILGVKEGDQAIEIGPKAQDKGVAIDEIMQQEEALGRIPIFWGDSKADIPGGLRAKHHGGIFISVGSNAELKAMSDIHFDTPEQARQAIYKICDEFGKKEQIPEYEI